MQASNGSGDEVPCIRSYTDDEPPSGLQAGVNFGPRDGLHSQRPRVVWLMNRVTLEDGSQHIVAEWRSLGGAFEMKPW